ncbi:hypothetical protein [Chondromyces crocatus]|uniref:Uncharacterized protein n=1 Tax=Chondromyces crocatus TaxID=52 RepID=A0A0K1EFD0_CHOCO|nr:hypothetical protein [Chondromyces crocatus]AKT39293.1 uncharacterized protein CMC5_034410 [Chondromyces crocatus]
MASHDMAVRWFARRIAPPFALTLLVGGCGLLLGLDDFSDAPAGGEGAGTGQGSCEDEELNGDETDVDCGGSCPAGCAAGQACRIADDCRGGTCGEARCQPTCSDDERNGGETDIDCGGETCPACATNLHCATDGDCVSGLCDGVTCLESVVWARNLGSTDRIGVRGIALNEVGSVLLHGMFGGTVSFGGQPLNSGDYIDLFVAKLNPAGEHLWSKGFGDDDIEFASAIRVSTDDSVVLTGYFDGSVDFGGGALPSGDGVDIYLAKLSPSGTHLWSKRFGASSSTRQEIPSDLRVDAQGNVYVSGGYQEPFNFGGATLPGGGSTSSGVFIAKLDAAGVHVWSRGYLDTGVMDFPLIDIDGTGNVFMAGVLQSSINFGGGALMSAGGNDVYLVKLNASGSHVWSHRVGDAAMQTVTGVAADAQGDVVLVGRFKGTIDFGGGTLSASGNSDIFVAKLDRHGDHVWSKRFDDDNTTATGVRVAVSPIGHVFVASSFSGLTDLGGGVMSSAGGTDVFVLELTAAGEYHRSRRFGGPGDQDLMAIALSGGHLVLGGQFKESVDFGAGPIAASGEQDVFLAKLRAP